jgi:hypothetical protein
MNVAGTQTLAAPTAPASNIDKIRRAITLVRVGARSESSAIVLNPTDAQNIDLLKESNEATTSSIAARTASVRRVSGACRWSIPTLLQRARVSWVTSARRC